MVLFLGWAMLLLTVLLSVCIPEFHFAVVVTILVGCIFATVCEILKPIRWGIVVSFFFSLYALFHQSPTVGASCQGIVEDFFQGSVVVSVYECGTPLIRREKVIVYCGDSCFELLYTIVDIKVVSGSSFGPYVATGVLLKRSVNAAFAGYWAYAWVLRSGYVLKAKMYDLLLTISNENIAVVGVGVLFGKVRPVPEYLSQLFIDLGIAHIFAVSGINIQYLLQFVEAPIRKKGWRVVMLAKGLIAVVLGILVGPTVSFLRAATSLLVDIIGRSVGFVPNKGRIFLVLTLLLFFDPTLLHHASYWFVGAACFGVYIAAPVIVRSIKSPLLREMVTAIVVWICVAPVGVMYFKRISIPGLVVGFAVAPLVELVSITGYVVAPILLFFPVLGWVYSIIISVFLVTIEMFHGLVDFGG